MILRTGFVSNSSSQSFVCDICHDAVDLETSFVEYVYMLRCEKNHFFCKEHVEKYADFCREIKHLHFYEEEIEGGGKYLEDSIIFNLPSRVCPICTGNIVTDEMLIRFLEKEHNTTREKIKEFIIKDQRWEDLL